VVDLEGLFSCRINKTGVGFGENIGAYIMLRNPRCAGMACKTRTPA
jgi:hypothetical protein